MTHRDPCVCGRNEGELCGPPDRDERLRHVSRMFVECVEHALTCIEHRSRGGQQVPYTGDFAGATPSTLSRLRWWAREFRAAMGGEE